LSATLKVADDALTDCEWCEQLTKTLEHDIHLWLWLQPAPTVVAV